jgi:hypothetical protein
MPPSNPKTLFNTHYKAFTDDVPRVNMHDSYSQMFSLEERRILGLFRLRSILLDLNSDLLRCGITLTEEEELILLDTAVDDAILEDLQKILARLKASKAMFTKSQNAIFKEITRSVVGNKGKMVYIDGPEGSGKTFMLNALIDFAYHNNTPRLVVASSGVASLLLKGRRTAHSTFKILILCDAGLHCSIDPSGKDNA